eukprot:c53743_g1_i1.p2 GENE.c53743_g1_i1~~c53743_g1_i1.p2  ORF type:complete len:292 (+),score=73.63 c53743_g1_i1:48-923(+)
MLTAAARAGPAVRASVRAMATLQDMNRRITGVKNMKKITSSMKMVAAAKLRRAENDLGPAKMVGLSTKRLVDKVGVPDTKPAAAMLVCITADRGLCGAANSSVAKATIQKLKENQKAGIETSVVTIGEKGRLLIRRDFGKSIVHSFNDFGKTAFSYAQAGYIVDQMMSVPFDHLTIFHNVYKNKISYITEGKVCLAPEKFAAQVSAALGHYNLRGDRHMLENYAVAHIVNTIYAGARENNVVELAQRMSAMDNATSNAGDMIASLQLMYNRQRQAVITRELIEIISGANAL